MESMFGWAAINAILIAYGFGQKKWKFLMIPIAVKLCFWIASIYLPSHPMKNMVQTGL